ncbi:acetoin utilization protein AcuC [Acidianus sulfidivorans]|uniref:acetoin utilization protein AcuC n=1 Tax=Acidianus sulfidivorans TaxID=312539 RepID=UPI001F10D7F9|nr:acetoin utilization protein AcuC [Acidianus sulfidivorans]
MDYSFPLDHPFKSLRESIAKKLMEERGFFHYIDIVTPKPADDQELEKIHDPQYIKFVKEMSQKGTGYLDNGDTPAFKGIYEAAKLRVGGSIKALEMIESGYDFAINIGGGFHHAKRSSAEGFCVFNDVALVSKLAEKKYKVAIIDIDGHHGDGTQELLYDNNRVLKISLHMYHKNFFPGSGNYDEIGEGNGKGLTLNVPLPPGTADDAYIYAFKETVIKKLRKFKPELVIIVEGGDSHFGDPLVELKLSTKGYHEVIKKILDTVGNSKIILLGGGGYNYDATARVWTISIAEIAGIYSPEVDILQDCCYTASTNFVMNKVKDVVEKIKEIHNLD